MDAAIAGPYDDNPFRNARRPQDFACYFRLPQRLAAGVEREDIALVGANDNERRIRAHTGRKLASGVNPPYDGAARGIDANDGAARLFAA